STKAPRSSVARTVTDTGPAEPACQSSRPLTGSINMPDGPLTRLYVTASPVSTAATRYRKIVPAVTVRFGELVICGGTFGPRTSSWKVWYAISPSGLTARMLTRWLPRSPAPGNQESAPVVGLMVMPPGPAASEKACTGPEVVTL